MGAQVPTRQALAATVRQLWRGLRGGQLTPRRAAASVALGVFVGCMPLYGAQFWICLAIALPLRLDYPLALLATLVANPVTMPLLLLVEVEIGSYLWTGRWLPFSLSAVRSSGFSGMIGYATLGSVVLGSALAALAAGLVGLWVRSRSRRAAVPAVRPSQPVPSGSSG